jgi:hypothetical protein
LGEFAARIAEECAAMFETEIEMDDEGMTVPYPSLFDDVRKNHGFVDLRGRPELASEIMEGTQSSAMKRLLIKLAQPESKFFTIGCDLGTKHLDSDEFSHTAGGYIQIMNADYVERTPEDYTRFASGVAETLKMKCERHQWQVHFLLKPVQFNLDNFNNMTGSLWIWFHVFSDSAESSLTSREVLILALDQSFDRSSSYDVFWPSAC